MYLAAVLTVSDRSARGERPDASGPAVVALLEREGYRILRTGIVPDDRAVLETTLREWTEPPAPALLITTGGTGFSPRDVTPEATLAVCERLTPGIPEAMRAASLAITPRAMLSRAQAGIRSKTLIINLPGSPKAATENLSAVLPALSHGLDLLLGPPADCAGTDPPG